MDEDGEEGGEEGPPFHDGSRADILRTLVEAPLSWLSRPKRVAMLLRTFMLLVAAALVVWRGG